MLIYISMIAGIITIIILSSVLFIPLCHPVPMAIGIHYLSLTEAMDGVLIENNNTGCCHPDAG